MHLLLQINEVNTKKYSPIILLAYDGRRNFFMMKEVMIWAGAGTDYLIDGGATASYFYGPLKPHEVEK